MRGPVWVTKRKNNKNALQCSTTCRTVTSNETTKAMGAHGEHSLREINEKRKRSGRSEHPEQMPRVPRIFYCRQNYLITISTNKSKINKTKQKRKQQKNKKCWRASAFDKAEADNNLMSIDIDSNHSAKNGITSCAHEARTRHNLHRKRYYTRGAPIDS